MGTLVISQPRIPCPERSLCTIRDLKFIENARDMIPDRLQAYSQTFGNFIVRIPAGDVRKNFPFAIG